MSQFIGWSVVVSPLDLVSDFSFLLFSLYAFLPPHVARWSISSTMTIALALAGSSSSSFGSYFFFVIRESLRLISPASVSCHSISDALCMPTDAQQRHPLTVQ